MIKLFCGEDKYDSYKDARKQALESAKKLNANFKILDADELQSAGEFMQEIEGLDMFSDSKVVLAKRLLDNSEVSEYVNSSYKNLSKYEIFIWMPEKVDSRKSLVKKIKADKNFYEYKQPKVWQMAKWLNIRFLEQKIKLTNNQLNFIIERIGTDKNILVNEMEKFIFYKKIKKLKSFSDKDINIILGYDIKGDIWKFVDAVGQRDKKTALVEFKKITYYENQTQYLIAMIERELMNIAHIIYCKEEGIMLKETGLHPYVLKKTSEKSSNFSFSEIKTYINKLFELDFAIKSGEIQDDIGLVLFLNSL